jgi:exodeoxyribonuclease VII small subunit
MPARKTKATDGPDAAAEPDFETSLHRLQKIVEEMEGGDMTLERMMASFEEGRSLADLCNRKLQAAEKKIELLLRQDGRLETAPFEPESDSPGADGETQ